MDGDGNKDLVVGQYQLDKICTRPAPSASSLMSGSTHLAVESHSNPFLVDWDKDGDLDLLSGSREGGVFLFRNHGSKTAPEFGSKVALLEPSRRSSVGDGPKRRAYGPMTSTATAS